MPIVVSELGLIPVGSDSQTVAGDFYGVARYILQKTLGDWEATYSDNPKKLFTFTTWVPDPCAPCGPNPWHYLSSVDDSQTTMSTFGASWKSKAEANPQP